MMAFPSLTLHQVPSNVSEKALQSTAQPFYLIKIRKIPVTQCSPWLWVQINEPAADQSDTEHTSSPRTLQLHHHSGVHSGGTLSTSAPRSCKMRNNVMKWKPIQAWFIKASATAEGMENSKQSTDGKSNWKDPGQEFINKQRVLLQIKRIFYIWEREKEGAEGGERRISANASLLFGEKKNKLSPLRTEVLLPLQRGI